MSSKQPSKYDNVHDDWISADADTEVAPAVITGESVEQHAGHLGAVAYVPVEEELAPGDENAVLKLSRTSIGQLAALAYSSLERLVHCCGDRQPWVAFRTERIDALPSVAGADVLLWNEELPAEQRRDADGSGSE